MNKEISMIDKKRIEAASQRVEAGTVIPPRIRAAVQGVLPLVKLLSVQSKAGEDNCVIKFRPKSARISTDFLIAVTSAVRNVGRLKTLEASLRAEGSGEEAVYTFEVTKVLPREAS